MEKGDTMTHTYYAVEDGEIIFEVEAESQAEAEEMAGRKIWLQMHSCHLKSWYTTGRVIRSDEYNKEGVYRNG